jgi:hypothetical protein
MTVGRSTGLDRSQLCHGIARGCLSPSRPPWRPSATTLGAPSFLRLWERWLTVKALVTAPNDDLVVFSRAAKQDWPEHFAAPAHPISGHRYVRGPLPSLLDKPYGVRLPYVV